MLNLGWTVGEEILFKQLRRDHRDNVIGKVMQKRIDKCVAVTDSCVLGFEKKAMKILKHELDSMGLSQEFKKLEVVIRGNYLVKK